MDDRRLIQALRAGRREAFGEAFARCLDPRPWLDGVGERQWDNEVRARRKWPPLRAEAVDAGVLHRMTDRTAAIVSHDCAEIREAALAACWSIAD